MVMWAMFAAPLEIAADLRHIPAPSADILRNPVSCAGGHQCPLPKLWPACTDQLVEVAAVAQRR